MNKTRKCSSLSLIVLLFCVFAAVQALSVASAPSLPQFTVVATDHSYYVPPSTAVDPYTGKTVTTPGYTVENKTIDIEIVNQPFVSSSKYIYPAYSIRFRGHYEVNWTDLYSFSEFNPGYLASNSTYTMISLPESRFPTGGKVDFQVQAAIVTAHPIFMNSNIGYWTFENSGWSNIHTVSIPEASVSESPTPSNTGSVSPSQNPTASSEEGASVNFDVVEVAILAVLVVLAVLVAVLIVTLRRRR
jgi:hypothetical protein